MFIRHTILSALCIPAVHAGAMPHSAESAAVAEVIAPDVDAFRAAVIQTGKMDIEGNNGDLALTRLEFRAILSEPISTLSGLTVIPVLSYSATMLDFDGTPGGFPLQDEDLHSLSLSAFFIQGFNHPKWFATGWARAEMATDFQHITGDDFDFDVAAGIGYRFNERFSAVFGAVVLSLNGDTTVIPGIAFDWVPADNFRVGLYGPNFIASYKPDENLEFSVRGEPGGGEWNYRDAAGRSRTIDLTSYRLGLHASRRLTGELWLGVGAGVTLAGEIEERRNNGGNSFSRDLDESIFGQITLSLHRW
jgi:hypothetical protein